MKRMNEQNTAVIIVDIQERLAPAIHKSGQLTDACVTLLNGARLLELPIITTEQYPRGLGPTIEPLREFLSDVATFEKKEFTYAIEPVLEALSANQVEHVIVLGMETHICVYQGTRALLDAGYRCICRRRRGLRTEDNKANGLSQMQRMGAVITNVETVLFDLIGSADTRSLKKYRR